MSNNPVNVTLPQRINNTSPEFTMPPGESPRIHGMAPDGLGGLRAPGSWDTFAGRVTTAYINGGLTSQNSTPIATMFADNKILISYRKSGSSVDLTYTSDLFQVDWSGLSGWTSADYPDGVIFDLDIGGVGQPVANLTSYNELFMPYGYTFPFESGSMGVSAAPVASRWDSAGDVQNSNTLVAWAGANNSGWSGTATVNNGSTSVTLSGTPSFNAVGSFFRRASTTSRYTFYYRIVAHSGTSITLSRPYGYGRNTTDVPNISGASAQIDPIGWSVGAPPMCVCANTWRERVFTGRGAVPLRVGAFYGYYATLLAWSEPGNPWYFPSENFVLLGEDFSDPIMGMFRAGDSLLIFTRTKTFRLSGQDEGDFQLDQLSDRVGLVNSSAGTEFDTACVWLSPDGYLYTSEGGSPRRFTEYGPGRGLRIPHANSCFTSANSTSIKHVDSKLIISPESDYETVADEAEDMYIVDMEKGTSYTMSPHASALWRNTGTGTVGGVQNVTGFSLWRAADLTPWAGVIDGVRAGSEQGASSSSIEVHIPLAGGVGNPTFKINKLFVHHGATAPAGATAVSGTATPINTYTAFQIIYVTDQETDLSIIGSVIGQEVPDDSDRTTLGYYTWESSARTQLRGKYARLTLSRGADSSQAYNNHVYMVEAHMEPTVKPSRTGNQIN